jgi:hypothetical protein
LTRAVTLDAIQSPLEHRSMTTDPTTIGSPDRGDDKAHLSDHEAKGISRCESAPQLAGFVSALMMQRPVSVSKAALLLEHVIKETMSATVDLLAAQMRNDRWENDLSNGETLPILAKRAQLFLETPEGIQLFNFFAKTFAKTTGEMFD